MHPSEQTEGPRTKGQVEPPVQQPDGRTLVLVDARESDRSTRSRLPYAKTGSGNSIERVVQQWHVGNKTDLNKKVSTDKKENNRCTG